MKTVEQQQSERRYVKKVPLEARARIIEETREALARAAREHDPAARRQILREISGPRLAARYSCDRSYVTKLRNRAGLHLPHFPEPVVSAAERDDVEKQALRGLKPSEIKTQLSSLRRPLSETTIRGIMRSLAERAEAVQPEAVADA